MKEIVYNDLTSFRYKWLTFLIFNILFLYIFYFSYKMFNIDSYKVLLTTLALDVTSKSNVIEFTMYFYKIFIALFLSTYIFTKSFETAIENLFLRIDTKRWCYNRFISINVYIILFELITYIVIFLENKIYGATINDEFFLIIITNCLIVLTIVNLLLLFYILISNKTKFIVLLIFIVNILYFFPINTILNANLLFILILILSNIAICFLFIKVFKKRVINIYENLIKE